MTHVTRNDEASPASPEAHARSGSSREDFSARQRPKDDEQQSGQPEPTQPKGKPKTSSVPDWITANIKRPRSLKDLAKCWLASWVCILLLLPETSLQTLGQAAFFVCMVTVFLPANMPFFLWIFANGTLVLGACIGWAWGCAAMATALRARDATLLQSQLQTVAAGVAGATNPEAAYQAAIFQANFLDGRSSAVYGVFLVIGSYASAVLFTQTPKLRLTAIFITIVLDVMCTYGPLFPVAQYTLGTTFLLPIGVSLGVSFCCMLLVFPETLSHSWQNNLIKLLGVSKGYINIQTDFLSELSQSTDMDSTISDFGGRMMASRMGQLALLDALDGPKKFLPMEMTYAPLSGQDLARLLPPCRLLVLRLIGMGAFRIALQTTSSQSQQEDSEDETSAEDLTKPIHVHDTHAMLHYREKVADAEKRNHVVFKEDLLPILVDGSNDMMSKSSAALDALIAWLEYTNTNRWRGQSAQLHNDHVSGLQTAIDDLEQALHIFTAEERLKLIAPYEQHFDSLESSGESLLTEEGSMSFRLGARGLFLSLLWCTNAISSAQQVIVLAKVCHTLALKRTKSRLWMPSALSKLGHALVSKREGDAGQDWPTDARNIHNPNVTNRHDEDADRNEHLHDESGPTTRVGSLDVERDGAPQGDGEKEKDEAQAAQLAMKKEKQRLRRLAQRDPDSLPPTKWYHHVGRFAAACHTFFWSPRGVFALRFVIAGVVAWIPSVATQQSAAFSYSQRGLWALIMAQLSISLTHGELVFSIVARIVGTAGGALLGAALWYISCGNSPNGNPYGFGAATAVAFVPLVFFRLFAPVQLLVFGLMIFVTMILTIGYSWIDVHLTVTVSSGIGIEVAWRRMLLVLVGIAVGVIIMVIPQPTSTRIAVRQALAKLSQRNLSLYSSLVEIWAIQSASFEGEKPEEGTKSRRSEQQETALISVYRAQLMAAYEAHKAIGAQIPLARLDMQLRGRWPRTRYEQLLKAEGNMISALAQLYAVVSDKDYTATWQRRFAHATALLDPSTISDVSLLLSLLAQALQTGSRLPHATFLVRERALRHQSQAIRVEEQLRRMGSHHATPRLSLEILKAEAFMKHVQGAVALQVFLVNLDEAAAVVRTLVGEVPLNGYDALKDRWDDRALLLYT